MLLLLSYIALTKDLTKNQRFYSKLKGKYHIIEEIVMEEKSEENLEENANDNKYDNKQKHTTKYL